MAWTSFSSIHVYVFRLRYMALWFYLDSFYAFPVGFVEFGTLLLTAVGRPQYFFVVESSWFRLNCALVTFIILLLCSSMRSELGNRRTGCKLGRNMSTERKAPSLTDLCIRTAIDNVRYLGNLSGIDPELLARILPHCTVDQLMHIERSSKVRILDIHDLIRIADTDGFLFFLGWAYHHWWMLNDACSLIGNRLDSSHG